MKILRNLFFVTFPALVFIFFIFEITFSFIIPAATIPDIFWDPQYKIDKWDRSNGETGLYTMGKFAQQRGRWRVNNHGWNSPIDYRQVKSRPRIAVIGDSYIEALQVDIAKSYPYLLAEKLKGRFDVYSFGFSGYTLSQYLHVNRYVDRVFNPDIIIFNIVSNDFDESILALYPEKFSFLTLKLKNGTIYEILPRPPERTYHKKLLKYLLNKSDFLRYLYYNLRFSIIIDKKLSGQSIEQADVKPAWQNKEICLKVADYVLTKIKSENTGKRVIFVMDAERGSIYNGTLQDTKLFFLHGMMANLCKKYGFEFLDLTGPMPLDYKKNKKKFESRWDYHWDEYGHEFVATLLYEYLMATPGPKP